MGAADHQVSREPIRVLVVDDEPDLVEAVARGLRREGYAVDTALDGDDAVVTAKLEITVFGCSPWMALA